MELRFEPPYVFEQVVNEATGYSFVLLEDRIEIEEEEPTDGTNIFEDATSISLRIKGHVIPIEEVQRLWDEKFGLINIVENPIHDNSDPSAGIRIYEPLTHFPSLYRTFSNTPVTPEGVLQFANRFGLLTDRDELDHNYGEVYVPELFGNDEPVHAEGLDDWLWQLAYMREVTCLWDMVRSGDNDGLSKYLRWKDGKLAYWSDFQGLSQEFNLISDPQNPELDSLDFRPGDLIEPGMFVAAAITNMGLQGRVSPSLEMEIGNFEPRLAIRPLNLLGAMWLQTARTLDGNKEHRSCPNCGSWFEVGEGGYSRARWFCSNRCRVAHSRARHRVKGRQNERSR